MDALRTNVIHRRTCTVWIGNILDLDLQLLETCQFLVWFHLQVLHWISNLLFEYYSNWRQICVYSFSMSNNFFIFRVTFDNLSTFIIKFNLSIASELLIFFQQLTFKILKNFFKKIKILKNCNVYQIKRNWLSISMR